MYLIDYLEERGIGWTAWSWYDKPYLVGAEYQPTAFGQIVRDALRVG
jgi:hypothetical protein